jgi:hypothetical protein
MLVLSCTLQDLRGKQGITNEEKKTKVLYIVKIKELKDLREIICLSLIIIKDSFRK